MTHLLTHEQRMITFERFSKQLAPKRGKLLLICSLHSAEIYPFDRRTKGLFIKSRLDPAMLRGELEHVGFKLSEKQMADLLDHIKKQFDSPTGFQTTGTQIIMKCRAD